MPEDVDVREEVDDSDGTRAFEGVLERVRVPEDDEDRVDTDEIVAVEDADNVVIDDDVHVADRVRVDDREEED